MRIVDPLAEIRETGWYKPTGLVWHYFVAGRSICHRSIGLAREAQETDCPGDGESTCYECAAIARRARVPSPRRLAGDRRASKKAPQVRYRDLFARREGSESDPAKSPGNGIRSDAAASVMRTRRELAGVPITRVRGF